ncbi:MAG: PhoP regulatory network YrbL family protein [Marinovum sp.]|nr:PhoP regulatory network YrbL family protein [Marinovum sp.]
MPSKHYAPHATDEIARGSEWYVFMLKDMPDVLLKVMKPKHVSGVTEANDRAIRDWLRIRRAYGVYRREQRAWTDAMLRAAARGALPPLAGVGDFIMTPDGLGQFVERVKDANGETAQTLDDLLNASGRLSDAHLKALNVFVMQLYDWHIPAYDLGPKNIVWQAIEARFVLVGGFGDRAAIPLVTWFRAANNWQLDRSFKKTDQRSVLSWNRRSRKFFNPKTRKDVAK